MKRLNVGLIILCALGIISCCDSNYVATEGDTEDFATVYSENFESNAPIGWLTNGIPNGACTPLIEGIDANGNHFVRSSAPWWLDENHAPPGLGYLNLVAFAYHQDWGQGGEIGTFNSGRPIDLRNAELVLRWRAPDLLLPPTSTLVFWFQTRIPQTSGVPKSVNYVLTGQPLQPQLGKEEWQMTTLSLMPTAFEFTCLGSRLSRVETYGCADSVEEALKDWNLDMGFVILMPDRSMGAQIAGHMDIDSVSLRIPWKNVFTHMQAPATLFKENRTCLIPDPPVL